MLRGLEPGLQTRCRRLGLGLPLQMTQWLHPQALRKVGLSPSYVALATSPRSTRRGPVGGPPFLGRTS